MESLTQFLSSSTFMPLGHCYLWPPDILWTNVISDGLIAVSYYSIPASLVYLVRKRKDLAFNWVFLLFALFILACGTTHIFEIFTVWVPAYGAAGLVKAVTAGVSVVTAVGLWILMPRALTMPSLDALRESEAPFKAMVAGVRDYAIFLLDTQGMISSWNAGAERIKGYSESEIVGRHFSTFYTPEDIARNHPANELEIAAREGKYEEEGLRVRKNGERFWANVIITARRDQSGNLIGFSKVTRDITERRKAEDQLRHLNEELEDRVHQRTKELAALNKRLAKLLEVAPVGVAVADDPSCEQIHMNPAFAKMLGLSVEDNASKTAQRRIPLPFRVVDPVTGEEVAGSDLPMQLAASTGREIRGVEFEIRRDDGKHLNLFEYAIPLLDDHDQVEGCLGIFVDITDHKRAEKDLALAKEAAEAANRAKSEFLANMSHEIRTPLTAIMGYTQLLREPGIGPEEQATYLDTVERNGRVLGQLIDDILDLSKVEAGRLHLEKTRVSVQRLLSDLRSTMSVLADTKGIRLSLRTAAGTPATVVTDPIRLRQILVNLIGNAIKFTDDGGVDVLAEVVYRADSPSGSLCFTITDSGCGLAPEAQEKLFRPFVQADSSATRRFGGTGLGLVLSRRLAQALGGDVVLASSELGKGSVFSTWVDAGPKLVGSFAEAPMGLGTPPTERETGAAPKLDGLKILVAEDSPDNQALIRRILQRAGAQVEIVGDGRTAVDRALAKEHDLILMDVQMPTLDGYGATSLLRSRGYEKPIIALTAHAMPEERDRSEAAGCNDHLAKPINLGRLIDKIRQYAGRGDESLN